MNRAIPLLTGLLAVAVTLPGPANAQSASALTLMGGITEYDLSGVDTRPFVALRGEVPLSRFMLVEPGLGFFRYETQGGADVNVFLPEVQLQAAPMRTRVRPYLGAGVGLGHQRATGATETDLTLSGAAGLRAALTPALGLRGELRVRSIDPWTGSTADFGAGLSYVF